MRVTALAGGTGAAKLVRGLAACLPASDLTIVGNTGDDTEIWGLHVSPDLDTLTYALAGRLDVARGWGLAGETFRCLQAMADLGGPTWFNLGDGDLATHLVRTQALRAGATLTAVTAEIAGRLGVRTTNLAHERSASPHAHRHAGRMAILSGILRPRERAGRGRRRRVRRRGRGPSGTRSR